jgi:hypothetical protein
MNTIEPEEIRILRSLPCDELLQNREAQILKNEWFLSENERCNYNVYKIPNTWYNKFIIKLLGYEDIWK